MRIHIPASRSSFYYSETFERLPAQGEHGVAYINNLKFRKLLAVRLETVRGVGYASPRIIRFALKMHRCRGFRDARELITHARLVSSSRKFISRIYIFQNRSIDSLPSVATIYYVHNAFAYTMINYRGIHPKHVILYYGSACVYDNNCQIKLRIALCKPGIKNTFWKSMCASA